MPSAPSPIRIGPAGWSYPDWEGRVYPRPRPHGFDPLAWVARHLDCVEVNATFYAVPPPRRAAAWVERIRPWPDFRFLAKLHRAFTHGPLAEVTPSDARAFVEAVAPLEEAGRLGAVLAQFPHALRFDEPGRVRLERIAELFHGLPLVVEVRSRTFFGPEGLSFLEGLGVGLAHIDLPAARDHPPPRHACLGAVGYVRLHGRNARTWFDGKAGRDERYDYLYGREELEEVAARARHVAAASRETYLVTNNHYGGQAVANALELKGLLEGRPPLAPQVLREAFPHLLEVTRPQGQQSLF